MAGLAAKGYTRAAVSCTCSTSGFQNSRNEVLALLAEAFGNPSVWSQHVTKGIINLLYSTTSFVTSWNQSTSPYRWIWPRLGIPPRNASRIPKAKKSCSSWVVGECHGQKLKHFVKRTFTASNTNTNMTNGIQLQILNFKESENEFWNGNQWMLGRVLERLVAAALASIFYAHLEAPQPKGFEAFLPKSNILSSGLQGLQHKNKHDQWNSATDSCCFFTFKCARFSLKMQPLKWYEWVRCDFWRLQGCDLGYETVWPIPQWKTRSSTSRKARMNFGTGTSECWAESLNGSWLMRWPASFMRIWKPRSQKDLRRSYPGHVHVLLFVKPDPGHAIGEELAASVGTGTCGHSQLQVSTKADNGNWEVNDRYQISDLCNASRGCQGSPHFLSCIPPKSKSEIWHLGSTTARAKLQFAW